MRNPSLLVRVLLLGLFLAGLTGAGWWKWRREHPEPLPELSPAQREQARADGRALRAKMLGEFPALAMVAPRPVADEDNGYLQIYLYSLENGDEPRGEVFSKLWDQPGDEFDVAAAEAALAEHAEFVAWVERVAQLPGSSSLNMPAGFSGTTPGRLVKTSVEALLVKGRLAAMRGDEDEALRALELANRFLDHLAKSGRNCLFDETIIILCGLSHLQVMTEEILPTLGPRANLDRWQAAMFRRSCDPASFAELIRGEWHTATEFMLLQAIRGDEKFRDDPEEFVRVYSRDMDYWVRELPMRPMVDLMDKDGWTLPSASSGLSEHALDYFGGSWSWGKGYLRAASVQAQHAAALDLLQLERGGKPLDGTSAAGVTCDPVSGLPFEFDPATRTLRAPEQSNDLGVDPLPLPW